MSDTVGMGQTTESCAPFDVGADHGHWAAFDNTGGGDFVCACGLPWTTSEGCAFVQGARALESATRVLPPGECDNYLSP